jgi:hypothetical protein
MIWPGAQVAEQWRKTRLFAALWEKLAFTEKRGIISHVAPPLCATAKKHFILLEVIHNEQG